MNLSKVLEQDLAKQVLQALVKNPYNIPNFIVLAGPYGTGRKTLARNFIKSLYCENLEKYSNCGTCKICRGILNEKPIYREYDCSQIDTLEFSQYIVITNFEKCPRNKQMELYNWFNTRDRVPTIILITETTDNIIDNINSLSLILRTSLLTKETIVNNLYIEAQSLNLDTPKDILDTIARRSQGHYSDALKMLQMYSTLDKETFNQSILSAREYFILFLIGCYQNKQDIVDRCITQLKNIPLAYLKIDYEALIVEIMKTATKYMKPTDKYMEGLIKEIKTKALDLYYILNDKIIYNSFTNDDAFQAAMYVIYLKLNKRIR